MTLRPSARSTTGRGAGARLTSALCLLVALSTWELQAAPAPAPTPTAAPSKPRKLALLVGIDRYQAVTRLHGCVNDVERMRSLLVGRFGFLEKDVLVLEDGAATNAGIRRAFQKHLIDQAKPNDVVVFHFSGHGSRMPDVSGDEIDGWDETIVPVDSRQPGIFDIPDDDLNVLLTKLSRKTPFVTFILDSCHSGSASRGGVSIRRIDDDTRTPPAPPGGPSSVRGGAPVRFAPSDASYVLIAGCGPAELSNEYEAESRSFGALTFFLSSALSRSGSETTYRDVMDRVRSDVAAVYPSQHPQLEGPRLDTEIFGTGDRLAEPYLLAAPLGGSRVEVQGGLAHGLTDASTLDVYAPHTKKFVPGQATSRIQLTRTEAFRSEGKIVSGRPVAAQSRAVLRERAYPGERFRIYLGKLTKPELAAELRERLKEYAAVEVVAEESAARMSVVEKGDDLQCLTGDLESASPPVRASDPESAKRVAEQIGHWAKWQTIFSLSNQSPTLRVRLDLPVPAAGTFTEGDQVDVSVTNGSQSELYVAILDLSGDGSAEPLYPRSGVEETLAPNKTLTQKIQLTLPEGRESLTDVIKVIASTQYIEPAVFRLEPFRGDAGPLARLIADASSRGAAPVDLQGWTTVQRPLRITRKKTPQPTTTPGDRSRP